MTSRDFCYWLQGYFELKDAHYGSPLPDEAMDAKVVTKIRQHLAMVFKHEIDPSMGDQKHQDQLSLLHKGLSASELLSLRSLDLKSEYNC